MKSMESKEGFHWRLVSRFALVWPSITDQVSAKKASRQGLLACACCAGATILCVLLGYFGPPRTDALVDALLFILIGWGIHRISRFAAVAGLLLFILERVFEWLNYGRGNTVVALLLALAFTLAFINSVRGTFAYHRYSGKTGEQGGEGPKGKGLTS